MSDAYFITEGSTDGAPLTMNAATFGRVQYRRVVARDPADDGYDRGGRRLDTMSPDQHHGQRDKHFVGAPEVDRVRNAHRRLRFLDLRARVSTGQVNSYTRAERPFSQAVPG